MQSLTRTLGHAKPGRRRSNPNAAGTAMQVVEEADSWPSWTDRPFAAVAEALEAAARRTPASFEAGFDAFMVGKGGAL